MNESDQSGHTIRSINDGVSVEVIDIGDSHEETSRYQMEFREVTILDNGWIRCVGRVDIDPSIEGVGVDHYPPERVNAVFSTEPEGSDE